MAPKEKLRYAVVGLGHISQVAVLPAFANARRNSELTALVSGDRQKLRRLGRKYKVDKLWSYRDYAFHLAAGEIDAAFIALPNHLHRKFVVQAAQAGVHVICEKPLAVTEADARAMIKAARRGRTRLMTAYRLHLDPDTLKPLELVRKGKIGRPRFMQAALSLVVKDPANIRRYPRRLGGGPLYDLGIYCINAARTFFGAEPVQVAAQMSGRGRGVETTLCGLLKFPGGRLATFACSTEAAGLSEFTLVGDKGLLRLKDAFEYVGPREQELILGSSGGEKPRTRKLPKQDQFAAELLYFSDCVLEGRDPQPSGWEGLADLRVIRALHRAAQTGRSQALPRFARLKRPQKSAGLRLPPVKKVKSFHAKSPSKP